MKYLSIILVVTFIILGVFCNHMNQMNLEKQREIYKKHLDHLLELEYVQGYNDAIECRAILSAPSCELILEKSGK